MKYIILYSVIIFILLIIPLKVKIYFNLDYYQISIYKLNIYKKRYINISDINKERNVIKYLKIFKVIDIKTVNLEIGGIKDYYFKSLSYSLMYIFFNLLGLVINDQFIFNYYLDYSNNPKINFECIINSNMGKILLGLIRRRE